MNVQSLIRIELDVRDLMAEAFKNRVVLAVIELRISAVLTTLHRWLKTYLKNLASIKLLLLTRFQIVHLNLGKLELISDLSDLRYISST